VRSLQAAQLGKKHTAQTEKKNLVLKVPCPDSRDSITDSKRVQFDTANDFPLKSMISISDKPRALSWSPLFKEYIFVCLLLPLTQSICSSAIFLAPSSWFVEYKPKSHKFADNNDFASSSNSSLRAFSRSSLKKPRSSQISLWQTQFSTCRLE